MAHTRHVGVTHANYMRAAGKFLSAKGLQYLQALWFESSEFEQYDNTIPYTCRHMDHCPDHYSCRFLQCPKSFAIFVTIPDHTTGSVPLFLVF